MSCFVLEKTKSCRYVVNVGSYRGSCWGGVPVNMFDHIDRSVATYYIKRFGGMHNRGWE